MLADEGLPANAVATGALPQGRALTRLAAGSPVLGDVRGAGLYLGRGRGRRRRRARRRPSWRRRSSTGCATRRVLISATGPRGHVLKIRPPLPFGRAHADQLMAALSDVLSDVPETS